MFSGVCLSVCLFVQNNLKSTAQIWLEFLDNMGILVNFGGDSEKKMYCVSDQIVLVEVCAFPNDVFLGLIPILSRNFICAVLFELSCSQVTQTNTDKHFC